MWTEVDCITLEKTIQMQTKLRMDPEEREQQMANDELNEWLEKQREANTELFFGPYVYTIKQLDTHGCFSTNPSS